MIPVNVTINRKDGNYKRTVIACFIQAVYLLELDRQDNRSNEKALAPKWWIPFKYKLVETLRDERDGSIFAAILEWDRAAALADFAVMRPSGAPRAILALRGTLLKSPTIRRDIEDDLRFLAWESLKGSVRFNSGLKALRSASEKYGSSNVCMGGHSLGASFALQLGKAMAIQGRYVETHLSMLPLSGEKTTNSDDHMSKSVMTLGSKQWVPHLRDKCGEGECENMYWKAFRVVEGKAKFLEEAHGLEQWWSDDLELELAINNSKLISRQLKSLYSLPPSLQSPNKGR
ncbi:hypothetical protein BUALT_BualtUnG0022500 [Buddleja alternifolia]|uniref:Uncharacterized protein n=1 Tax=Buddleja alternifolia TaxID=168488 RepID=A0AAV6W5H0_9LAMI|nr:hypothetical protein BUALT_BualtUnG0022500 [Buddleja alternifolia]